jgi:hypothetical protein
VRVEVGRFTNDGDARVLAFEQLQDLVGLVVATLTAPPGEADLALDLAESCGRWRVGVLGPDIRGQCGTCRNDRTRERQRADRFHQGFAYAHLVPPFVTRLCREFLADDAPGAAARSGGEIRRPCCLIMAAHPTCSYSCIQETIEST